MAVTPIITHYIDWIMDTLNNFSCGNWSCGHIVILALAFLVICLFLRRFLDDEEREPPSLDAENGVDTSENTYTKSDDGKGFENFLNARRQGTVCSRRKYIGCK